MYSFYIVYNFESNRFTVALVTFKGCADVRGSEGGGETCIS